MRRWRRLEDRDQALRVLYILDPETSKSQSPKAEVQSLSLSLALFAFLPPFPGDSQASSPIPGSYDLSLHLARLAHQGSKRAYEGLAVLEDCRTRIQTPVLPK